MVSLFTGAGGLDYGFEAAGFITRVAVESDEDCYKTLSKNRQWPIINKDIHEITSEEILRTGNLHKADVDLIIGGPPCQPFSKSGYWVNGSAKLLDDPRADTLYAYMKCVREMLPKVFILENVHGINYSGKEEGFKLLESLTKQINQAQQTNYQLSWQVINMADYGIPQLRKRFFLIAHRDGKMFKFPKPMYRTTNLGEENLDEDENEVNSNNKISSALIQQKLLFQDILPPYITAWDAIGDLENTPLTEDLELKGKWKDLLPSIPEGQNYLWHTNRKGGLPLFGWRTRYWNFMLKLAKNQPSWTITAQPGPSTGPFHWKNRLLTVKELARLQTFPEEISFYGNRASVQKQIGNAVPSLMGEIIGREIATQFFNQSFTNPLQLAVKQRGPIPNPEPVLPVPRKYLDLIGNYPDHPGTGKGPGAQKKLTEAQLPKLRHQNLAV